jgi:hypothetical protein
MSDCIKKNKIVVLALLFGLASGCASTQYITDPETIERQHDMKVHRTSGNLGDVSLNLLNLATAIIFDSGYLVDINARERAFKKIIVVNVSTDTLFVNMVTDIVWKAEGYCDIMGIVLPPNAKQKVLLPFPAAYNIYFRTPYTEEETFGIHTDYLRNQVVLRSGMTKS